MNLDQQIQVLIDDAPQDDVTPQLVRTIAPVLKQLAQQLRHSQYYVLQTLDQNWVLTTLSNRTQPDVQKNIIYAFPTLKDVTIGPSPLQDPQLIALPTPVTHILFQMLAMERVDSTIFFETPGNTATGTEIRRQDLQNLVQIQIQATSQPQKPSGFGSNLHLPPDIA
ncbi:MAG: hypothetical protein KME16_24340 [Scytolyngbya sp. HA4215-MV1]|jgi:hypothetical protein|nr:hypothetical protein [Scytolyngbya sp. HA4215-MV1]